MYQKNTLFQNQALPVDIVFHPSWWFHQEGITFDRDFFFNPLRRVEVEKQMETALYERWGRFGLGNPEPEDTPEIGAVHLASGFLISEMLGCTVEYSADSAPQVLCANLEQPEINPPDITRSAAYRLFDDLRQSLKTKYGYLSGDVNWSGILNIALDLRGEQIYLDLYDQPEIASRFFRDIAEVIKQFTGAIKQETGSTSISVNRNVRNVSESIFLHSQCSHTMISVQNYERFLLGFDLEWSSRRPFGIHYCGSDPHRYAETFQKIPHLDFLDVGWGGDLKVLRERLPATFLNIRLSPVEIIRQSVEEIEKIITALVLDSANPWLTGICCINMDHQVSNDKITAILETVIRLREKMSVRL